MKSPDSVFLNNINNISAFSRELTEHKVKKLSKFFQLVELSYKQEVSKYCVLITSQHLK